MFSIKLISMLLHVLVKHYKNVNQEKQMKLLNGKLKLIKKKLQIINMIVLLLLMNLYGLLVPVKLQHLNKLKKFTNI